MARFSQASALVFVLLSLVIAGCAEAVAVGPARAPTGVGWQTAQLPPSSVPTTTTVVVPPVVPATVSAQSPTSGRQFTIDLDAAGRPLVEGEVVAVEYDRMIFLRDARMSPDCSNVQVKNLYVKKMGATCQVGVLPFEQGLKPGQTVNATWQIGAETKKFVVKVIPIDSARTSDIVSPHPLLHEARRWLRRATMMASL